MIAPKLRFSEFKDEWLDYSINDFAETVTSGSRDWAKYYSKSGDKFIRMTNLIRNGIYLNLDDLKFVNLPIDSNEGKRTSLQHGDILVSITAELGKIGWIPNDLGTAYINQHTALIRTNDKIIQITRCLNPVASICSILVRITNVDPCKFDFSTLNLTVNIHNMLIAYRI